MSKQTKFPKVKILGVEADNLSLDQALTYIIEMAQNNRAYYVVKPHVEHIEAASQNPTVAKLLNQADLALPDGVSLKWAAYFQQRTKHRLIDVVMSGAQIVFKPQSLNVILPNHAWAANFTWPLLQAAAQAKLKVFLVGSPKGVSIQHTKGYLTKQISNLNIVGTFPGRDRKTQRFSDAMKPGLLTKLKTVQPDLVLIGIGFPRQEQLIASLAAQLKHGVLIGEGGTFDYQSFGGKLKKAPPWIQHHGLEWLWRLVIEPSRLGRQLAIPRFIWKVYRHSH